MRLGDGARPLDTYARWTVSAALHRRPRSLPALSPLVATGSGMALTVAQGEMLSLIVEGILYGLYHDDPLSQRYIGRKSELTEP